MSIGYVLCLTVRAWCLWFLVPGLPRRVPMILGPLTALLVFEPWGTGGTDRAGEAELTIMALITECLIGFIVATPILMPVWIVEVVGGMVDSVTNLSFASIVNPFFQGASRGVWSTMFRQLTWGRLVSFALFPNLLVRYGDSVRLSSPGQVTISPQLLAGWRSALVEAGGVIGQTIAPLLIGCLLLESVVGLMGRSITGAALWQVVHLLKFLLAVVFLCGVVTVYR